MIRRNWAASRGLSAVVMAFVGRAAWGMQEWNRLGPHRMAFSRTLCGGGISSMIPATSPVIGRRRAPGLPVMSRPKSLRGGMAVSSAIESVGKCVGELEFDRVFEGLRLEIERAGDFKEGQWDELQTRMGRAAQELIDWCRVKESVKEDLPRGAIVLIEGLDKSGKSTQADMLLETATEFGADVRKIRFPDRTTQLGLLIDMFLRSGNVIDNKTMHLLFAANRWQAANSLKQSVYDGECLVLDRYSLSGVAYSMAKGLDKDWCVQTECGLPAPDVVIFMDIDPKEAAKRSGYGEEAFERKEFQTKVREAFKVLREDSWVWVDASGDRDEISAILLHAMERAIVEKKDTALGVLWSEHLPNLAGL